MAPSDWYSQTCLNTRICDQRDVNAAEKTIRAVHAIVHAEMTTMRDRLLLSRRLSEKGRPELNKLSAMPLEAEITTVVSTLCPLSEAGCSRAWERLG
jgi:hypothetical protein